MNLLFIGHKTVFCFLPESKFDSSNNALSQLYHSTEPLYFSRLDFYSINQSPQVGFSTSAFVVEECKQV